MEDLKSLIGVTVVIETEKQVLTAKLLDFHARENIIEFSDTRDANTGCDYRTPNFMSVYEIISIKRACGNIPNEDELCSSVNRVSISNIARNTGSSGKKNEYENLLKSATLVNLSNDDVSRINNLIENHKYIMQADKDYHDAIADMKKSQLLGIVCEITNYGRHSRAALMGLATTNRVYVLDLQLFGKIFKDLKGILEAKCPRKIVHYSHTLVDCLKRKYGARLNNIFDTSVAYCLLNGENIDCDLINTLVKVFQIPIAYLNSKDEQNLPFDACRRPITKYQSTYMAKLAVLQVQLYEHLLHDRMLKVFYEQCTNFSRTFCNDDDNVEVAMGMRPGNKARFQHIDQKSEWNSILNSVLPDKKE